MLQLITFRFEPIENIGEIKSLEGNRVALENTIPGTITSIALVQEVCACPKCYSVNVDCNEKTIKCNDRKFRSLHVKNDFDRNKVELTVIDTEKNAVNLTIHVDKIQTLLKDDNRNELSQNDLVEEEEVLIALSSMSVSVSFNMKNKHITSIARSEGDE